MRRKALFRRYFAAGSIVILLLVAGLAFLRLQGTYSGPPPILDPNFTLWTGSGNASQLMVWNLETPHLTTTQYALSRVTIQDRGALRLSLLQPGVDSRLVYLRLSETLDGQRLSALMHSGLSLWVLKEPCNCDPDPFAGDSVITAVETNDGVHSLSFVFTDSRQGTETLLGHRVIFIPTASNHWALEVVNIGREYANARWGAPESLTFSLVFSVGGASVGWHTAYFSQIVTQRSATQLGLVSEDVAVQSRVRGVSCTRLNV